MKVRFRPLTTWPGEKIRYPKPSTFSASWTQTMELLDREVHLLDVKELVIEMAITEADIRNDGWPYASARPSEPGVVVSFESKYGPLRYATNRFNFWQDNVRAIALGLEALRKVDRYGITKRGEQYTGWKQLGSGDPIAAGEAPMTRDEAAQFIGEHSDANQSAIIAMKHDSEGDLVAEGYRLAAKKLHPDAGGDSVLFRRLQAAKTLLEDVS